MSRCNCRGGADCCMRVTTPVPGTAAAFEWAFRQFANAMRDVDAVMHTEPAPEVIRLVHELGHDVNWAAEAMYPEDV